MSAKKTRTPQEKKRLSLTRDRRNIWGDNSKATRKALPRKRATKNRAFRRTVKQAIAAEKADADSMEAKVATVRRDDRMKKLPDQPLAVVLERRVEKRASLKNRKSNSR